MASWAKHTKDFFVRPPSFFFSSSLSAQVRTESGFVAGKDLVSLFRYLYTPFDLNRSVLFLPFLFRPSKMI